MGSSILIIIAGFIAYAVSSPTSRQSTQYFKGIATFNDYTTQPGVNCPQGNVTTASNLYQAATGTVSPQISNGGTCSNYQINTGLCDGTSVKQTQPPYSGPHCDTGNCHNCFEVSMVSTVDSAANISQSGVTSAPAAGSRSIKVQVVDSCPAESAYNFCKGSSVNPNERCGDPNTNSLDISQKAYMDLTGGPYVPYQSPNLNIIISPTSC